MAVYKSTAVADQLHSSVGRKGVGWPQFAHRCIRY